MFWVTISDTNKVVYVTFLVCVSAGRVSGSVMNRFVMLIFQSCVYSFQRNQLQSIKFIRIMNHEYLINIFSVLGSPWLPAQQAIEKGIYGNEAETTASTSAENLSSLSGKAC